MNSVTIAGNIGKSELRELGNGKGPVLSFSVAESLKDDRAQWFNCSLFGKRAESLAAYLKPGTPVTVTGRIEVGTYQGKDGASHVDIKLYANDVALQGSKPAVDNTPF